LDEEFEERTVKDSSQPRHSRAALAKRFFFDHVMRSEESYSEKWLYVAENPIRKKFVERLEDWPYQGEIFPLEARGYV